MHRDLALERGADPAGRAAVLDLGELVDRCVRRRVNARLHDVRQRWDVALIVRRLAVRASGGNHCALVFGGHRFSTYPMLSFNGARQTGQNLHQIADAIRLDGPSWLNSYCCACVQHHT